jgi:hypothetical protein
VIVTPTAPAVHTQRFHEMHEQLVHPLLGEHDPEFPPGTALALM